jgi:hypothetical protein
VITPISKVGRLRIVNKKKILNKLSKKEKYINIIIVGIREKVKSFYT